MLDMGILDTRRAPTPLRITGIVIAFLATVWYTWFSLQEKAPLKGKTGDVAASATGSTEEKPSSPGDVPTESSNLIKK